MATDMRKMKVGSSSATLMVAFCRRARSISAFQGRLSDRDILCQMQDAVITTKDSRLKVLFEQIAQSLDVPSNRVADLCGHLNTATPEMHGKHMDRSAA